MNTNRIEAFSDGVIAIIVTIMVLDLKAPHELDWRHLVQQLPTFLSYALSFLAVAIYWVNHHQLLHRLKHVTRGILWANLHLLFWLSLMPFVTSALGNCHAASAGVALYGAVSFVTAMAYWLLRVAIGRAQPEQLQHQDPVHRRHDFRNAIALLSLGLSIPLCWIDARLGLVLLCVPPAIYFLTERTDHSASANLESTP